MSRKKNIPRQLDWRKMVPKQCIGFGGFEGKCTATAHPIWCERCDSIRCEHLYMQFKKIEEATKK